MAQLMIDPEAYDEDMDFLSEDYYGGWEDPDDESNAVVNIECEAFHYLDNGVGMAATTAALFMEYGDSFSERDIRAIVEEVFDSKF